MPNHRIPNSNTFVLDGEGFVDVVETDRNFHITLMLPGDDMLYVIVDNTFYNQWFVWLLQKNKLKQFRYEWYGNTRLVVEKTCL